jgi:uncharacterized protein YndB with AHSA1/START domain
MNEVHQRPTGLTKDTGFQIGVRRTLPIHLKDAWRLITSPQGIQFWLGKTEKLDYSEGAHYQLDDGTVGEVRVFKPNSHIRITWKPPGWVRAATIQVRVIPKSDRTVIAFHQEHLPGPREREQRRDHFKAVLDRLASLI